MIAGDPTGWRNLDLDGLQPDQRERRRVRLGSLPFPKDGPACGAATVTAGADLGFGSGAASHLAAHVVEAGIDGNGTPTAAAIGAGAAYLRTVTDQIPSS